MGELCIMTLFFVFTNDPRGATTSLSEEIFPSGRFRVLFAQTFKTINLVIVQSFPS